MPWVPKRNRIRHIELGDDFANEHLSAAFDRVCPRISVEGRDERSLSKRLPDRLVRASLARVLAQCRLTGAVSTRRAGTTRAA